MRGFRTFLLLVIVAGIALAAVVWYGVYNIAATRPNWEATRWFISQLKDRSILARSAGITVPSLDDPKYEEAGFNHYHGMCRLCHGAPGYPRLEFAKGLYPGPPDLKTDHIQKEWNDAQLYWIIREGIKLTGMPAFGPSHDDKELWGMVVFLRRLPGIQSEEYSKRAEAAAQAGEGEEPDHHH